jgi:hypothetical protein
VVERPHVGNRCLYARCYWRLMLVKMETGRGHLGGPVEHLEGNGGESVVAILRFLCGSPRLCRLRTEGLIPVSKYWTYRSHAGVYGSSKPSSLSSIKDDFTPTVSMAALGEKLSTHLRIGQPACCELCREPFFLGAVALFIVVDDIMKGCHVCGLSTGSIHGAYMDWREKHTCRVDRVFPCRVYIDSNHRDSRIWVTACSWIPSCSNLLD